MQATAGEKCNLNQLSPMQSRAIKYLEKIKGDKQIGRCDISINYEIACLNNKAWLYTEVFIHKKNKSWSFLSALAADDLTSDIWKVAANTIYMKDTKAYSRPRDYRTLKIRWDELGLRSVTMKDHIYYPPFGYPSYDRIFCK